MPNYLSMKILISPFFLLLLLLQFPFTVILAQRTNNNGNIAVGASITAAENSSPWLSPSGDFAFGFQKLNNSGEDDNLFLLCIWFAKLSNKTIVWFARSYNSSQSPATTTRGSKLSLTSDQGLVLTDPRGTEVWKSTSLLGTVSGAAMTDAGNLVLRDRTSDTLWQTFESPTDTLLPSQSLERGGSLSSRRSETNFTKGRFRLQLEEDGDLVLSTVNLPSTFANEAYFSVQTRGGTELVFNKTTALLYILRENGTTVGIGTDKLDSPSEFYLKATLEYDGIFILYSHPKSGNGKWTVVWSIPDNICQSMSVNAGLGVCGYNSICRLRQNEARPFCECPKGYSLADPAGDPFGDCKPDFFHGCEEDGNSDAAELYDVEVLINIDWPVSNYMGLSHSTAEMCRASCLEDCLCSAAVFGLHETCWKKMLPLSNGHLDTALNSQAFLKIRKPEFSRFVANGTDPAKPLGKKMKNSDRKGLILAGSVFLGTSVLVNILLVSALCVGFHFIYRAKSKKIKDSPTKMNLHRFDYKELEEATAGFKEELGRGAFGVVYKGTLSSGLDVAVKKLHIVGPDKVKEFENEASVIEQTHHKNLVKLVGFCDDGKNRMLVYEYLKNGTLASYIFGDTRPMWKDRVEVAVGIAKGLLYLHEECMTQIIHCDIKPQNILRDDYGNPKISDFGLAKLLMMDQSRTSTAIRGTKGYVAPEWFRNFPVTPKVDIYSFGVVLLEIICCRRNVDQSQSGKEILADWAYDCFRDGTLDALVSWEAEALEEREKLGRFVAVSMWCIQENPSLGPPMGQVVQMLEGVLDIQVPPCLYSYSITT